MLSTALAVVAYYVVMYATDAAGVPPNVSIGLQVRPRAREERDLFDGKQEPYWSRALLGRACVCVCASVRLCVFAFYLPLHVF
jgi:hypothetical protein